MTKQESLDDPNSCWNKARPDEQVFVLLGRDLAAPAGILAWAEERVNLGLNKLGDEQLRDAADVSITIACGHQNAAQRAYDAKLLEVTNLQPKEN